MANDVHKINEPIEVRYLAKDIQSGIPDLAIVIQKPDGTYLPSFNISEIVPGLYRASFIPDMIGYWYVHVNSNSYPRNTATYSYLVSPVYPWEKYDTNIGNDYSYLEDNTISITTSSTYQNKLSLLFTPAASGDYFIRWFFDIASSKVGGITKYRVALNNITTTESSIIMNNDYIYNGWIPISGFMKVSLGMNQNNLSVEFASLNRTAYIKNVRVLVNRIE